VTPFTGRRSYRDARRARAVTGAPGDEPEMRRPVSNDDLCSGGVPGPGDLMRAPFERDRAGQSTDPHALVGRCAIVCGLFLALAYGAAAVSEAFDKPVSLAQARGGFTITMREPADLHRAPAELPTLPRAKAEGPRRDV
jgi:hypothetical protein